MHEVLSLHPFKIQCDYKIYYQAIYNASHAYDYGNSRYNNILAPTPLDALEFIVRE